MNSFDGNHLHAALLQAVGEHGPEDRGRGSQNHLVSHEVHSLQVLVAHAQRDVTQLPLQPQLVHDGEGGRRVALQCVAEDAVAIARGGSHQRFVFCQTLCHFLQTLSPLLQALSPEQCTVLRSIPTPHADMGKKKKKSNVSTQETAPVSTEYGLSSEQKFFLFCFFQGKRFFALFSIRVQPSWHHRRVAVEAWCVFTQSSNMMKISRFPLVTSYSDLCRNKS